MAKGVLVHRADSRYDDFPEERYQFPKLYLKRVQRLVHDWIVYYEPRRSGGRQGYTSIAKIDQIVPDPGKDGMFIAYVQPGSFLPFEKFVPYVNHGGFMESDLEQADGSLNRGRIRSAVRPISDQDFGRILAIGFPDEPVVLPRVDENPRTEPDHGLAEEQMPFLFDLERARVTQTTNRLFRDRVFRRKVLEAYDSQCAVTSLRLINGGGRAEVEAAHIKPVAADGPDAVQNGIALSGTVHWMFDRGLISLGDDYEILISRQVNNPDQIESLINPNRRALVPDRLSDRPHPKYLGWHREYCFKA